MGKLTKPSLQRSQAGQNVPLSQNLNRWLSAITVAAMMALSTIVIAAERPQAPASQLSPQSAKIHISQQIRRQNIWKEVQRQLPNFPQENNYVSTVSGEVSETNTLVRRMIEYHNFRKGRSPRSRFDWKLTLADYLGIHEIMRAENYPGARKLTTNPMAGDITAIQGLDREQRNQFINTIVSLYDPSIPEAFFTPASPESTAPSLEPAPSEPAVEAPAMPNSPPPLAEPGAADLLRPRN